MERKQKGRLGLVSRVHGFWLKTRRGRLTPVVLGLGLLSLACVQPTVRPRGEITLTAQSVPLSAAEPRVDVVGALQFMGGLSLTSEDRRFGGLSGLTVEENQNGLQFIAITDEGNKVTARLVIENGHLLGVADAAIEPLLDKGSRPISGKSFGDAESITRLRDGRVLVGFERDHRIWAYGPGLNGAARVVEMPPGLREAPSNGGLESIANWPDGRILAITERLRTKSGHLAAFLFHNGAWTSLEWKASGRGFEPVDATVLPNGDLLVLERYFSALAPGSLSSRILRVKGDAVNNGVLLQGQLIAELTAPLIAENFEGIAAFRNVTGATQVVLVSDNNFNRVQRTLLLWFEMSTDQN